ncbi:MAG: beta-ketoacyl synthase chain length factor [Halofilum sp. (in: g-proteobacteria)]|nr:beta-ketoacyl synthase chain length factor [Halofilum sp. (in: g-proteobacteria)]
MRAVVRGVGLTGPGLPDWAHARACLARGGSAAAQATARPRSALLARAEARRATGLVHLALASAEQVLPAPADVPADLPVVFASADGDLDILERNCATLAEPEPWISPNRFHNSVHNAPSGYWSIATGCRGPSTTLCAGDESFAAGLLEAATEVATTDSDACLLVACDPASPPSLAGCRPVPDPFAVALLLGRDGPGTPLRLGLEGAGADTPCAGARLEALRTANPAARSLPLLAALAAATPASVRLARPGGRLRVDLEATP